MRHHLVNPFPPQPPTITPKQWRGVAAMLLEKLNPQEQEARLIWDYINHTSLTMWDAAFQAKVNDAMRDPQFGRSLRRDPQTGIVYDAETGEKIPR